LAFVFLAQQMNVFTYATPSQRGYTLPELLMGMALSLLIIAAATKAFGTSQKTWNAMTVTDAVHANARMALRNIREQAHMTGAAYLIAHNSDGSFSVEISASEAPGQAALAGKNGAKSVESLTLGHWRALDAIDCQGNTGSTHTSVRNDYRLNTNKELSCKDLNLSGSTYQALAEGVEDFQVRYAEANVSALTLQWKTANQVTDMTQVMAIEVCIRVASINTDHNTKPNVNLKGCQDEALPSDGRVRRTFKRVMALRNREAFMP
jgi:prepilin-type N-terminal cleavage/methylation domain-containing protein